MQFLKKISLIVFIVTFLINLFVLLFDKNFFKVLYLTLFHQNHDFYYEWYMILFFCSLTICLISFLIFLYTFIFKKRKNMDNKKGHEYK